MIMQLQVHLSNHLLPDNKLSDHRHTQTDRVSYAQLYKINMLPKPKMVLHIYFIISKTPILDSKSFMSQMHETKSWNFTVLPHETIPLGGPTLRAYPARSPALRTPRP